VNRNPRVECLVGEHRVPGNAEIVSDKDAITANLSGVLEDPPLYHDVIYASGIRSRINSGRTDFAARNTG
jgi:hypothetical protein